MHVSKRSHVPRQAAAELGMLLGRELVELRDVLVRAAQILMNHSLQLGHLPDVAERYRLGRERIERVHVAEGCAYFAEGCERCDCEDVRHIKSAAGKMRVTLADTHQ